MNSSPEIVNERVAGEERRQGGGVEGRGGRGLGVRVGRREGVGVRRRVGVVGGVSFFLGAETFRFVVGVGLEFNKNDLFTFLNAPLSTPCCNTLSRWDWFTISTPK